MRNWEEAREEITSLMQNDYKVELDRNGSPLVVTVSPKMLEFLKQPLGDIGVIPAFPPIIGAVGDPSPAKSAGLMADDEIIEIDGAKMNFWDELSLKIRDSNGSPVTLKISRDGREQSLVVTPQYIESENRYMMGVVVKDSETVRYAFPRNLWKAGAMIVQQASLAERTIRKLFQRRIPLKALSAPPSIAYIAGKVARTGFYNLFFLMGSSRSSSASSTSSRYRARRRADIDPCDRRGYQERPAGCRQGVDPLHRLRSADPLLRRHSFPRHLQVCMRNLK